MAEYIERDKLKQGIAEDALNYLSDWDSSLMELIMAEIDECPTADVAPVVHGRWGDNGIPNSMLSGCSVCGFTCGAYSFQYCPNCGAKMDGGADHDE